MGWMDIKGIGTWGDSTQDLVDNYLESYGWRFGKQDPIRFYNKASKDKKLAEEFSMVFQEYIGRKPTRKELLYHIRTGLYMKAHPFSDKIKRG